AVPPPMALVPPSAVGNYYYQPVTSYIDGRPVTGYRQVLVTAENEMALTRVVYKLSAAKAEALSAFLKDNVQAAVLETKVDGDSITVTTTPDVQRTIGQFVTLV